MSVVDHRSRENTTATESAGRTLDVLLQFLQADAPLGVSQIARELGMGKTVVHRALQTLVSRGFIEVEMASRQYRLGPTAALVGSRALRDLDLRKCSLETLERLHEETEETVTLSALVPGGRVYLEQIVSGKEITMSVEIGRLFPLHAGSSSKCILAFLSNTKQSAIIDQGLPSLTGRTITDPDELRKELSLVRESGFASSDGERQAEAGSVAAPVFGLDDSVVGSISVCGPKSRVNSEFVERVAPLVVAAAAEISARMGAPRAIETHDRLA
ncbi:IclR family transcriptional regulator [Streptomyces solisilvae]|uniref:IclR family transcriptional regulator n=1 Tax=Streptomyces malaysiensis TaxID=92644 RepID=UPI0036AAF14F